MSRWHSKDAVDTRASKLATPRPARRRGRRLNELAQQLQNMAELLATQETINSGLNQRLEEQLLAQRRLAQRLSELEASEQRSLAQLRADRGRYQQQLSRLQASIGAHTREVAELDHRTSRAIR
jgi:chromosome segregation ATPase